MRFSLSRRSDRNGGVDATAMRTREMVINGGMI
jgi:hypothetical protein